MSLFDANSATNWTHKQAAQAPFQQLLQRKNSTIYKGFEGILIGSPRRFYVFAKLMFYFNDVPDFGSQ